MQLLKRLIPVFKYLKQTNKKRGDEIGEFTPAEGNRILTDWISCLDMLFTERYIGLPQSMEQRVQFVSGYAEANKYLDVTCGNRGENIKSRVQPTAYAKAQGAYTFALYKTAEAAAGWWWLRSPGSSLRRAASVRDDGSLGSLDDGEDGVDYGAAVVRPAFGVNLESDIF